MYHKISGRLNLVTKNFQKKIPINPKSFKKTILKTLSLENIKKNGEITVSFVNERKIKELNLRYLGRNTPTDVLAFNISEAFQENKIFADIVISTDTAIRNSRLFKTSNLYELHLYVIHGLLHILGYDDKTQKHKEIMHKKAQRVLRNLRIN